MHFQASRTKIVDHIVLKTTASSSFASPVAVPNLFIRRRRSSTPWRNSRDARDERDKHQGVFAIPQRSLEDMTEKRGASAMSGKNWKKPKTEKEKKWYAVKSGKRPGVYETWDKCQEQTTGYHGAVYKSFTHKEDAEAFVAGRQVPDRGGKPKPMRYYAVARGNYTGIFNDWTEAQDSTRGAKGPKYKRFDTLHEAIAFMDEWADEETLERVREKYGRVSTSVPKYAELKTEPGMIQIYTDGSSLGNGTKISAAGVGVYFGKNDPRNVSERLDGEPQTNQRAELTAVLRALQSIPITKSAQIVTDSMYSINCATRWAETWEEKGWKTAEGNDVKNRDLIEPIWKKIVEREFARAKTRFTWVKGHSSTEGNIEADKLAVAGAYGTPKEVVKPAKGRTKLKTDFEQSIEDELDDILTQEADRLARASASYAGQGAPTTAKARTKLKTGVKAENEDYLDYDIFDIESEEEKDHGSKRRRR